MPKLLLSSSLSKKFFADLIYDAKDEAILCILEVPTSVKEEIEVEFTENEIEVIHKHDFRRKVFCNFPLTKADIHATFRSRLLEIRIRPKTHLAANQWIVKLKE